MINHFVSDIQKLAYQFINMELICATSKES
jgi:hypothetical protein